jgi:hypothetical protein
MHRFSWWRAAGIAAIMLIGVAFAFYPFVLDRAGAQPPLARRVFKGV